MGITSKTEGKKKTKKNPKKKLPDCPSNSPSGFLRSKQGCIYPVLRYLFLPSVMASYLRRNRDEEEAAARAPTCAVLPSWGKQSLLTALPRRPPPRLPWEPLRAGQLSGGLSLPKHTQRRGYLLSTNTAPLQSSSGRRVGG